MLKITSENARSINWHYIVSLMKLERPLFPGTRGWSLKRGTTVLTSKACRYHKVKNNFKIQTSIIHVAKNLAIKLKKETTLRLQLTHSSNTS